LLPEKANAETTQMAAVETPKNNFANIEYSPRIRSFNTEIIL
jgi:hypothetical protein